MFAIADLNTLARKASAAVEGSGSGHTAYAMDSPKARYVVGGVATRIYPIGEAVARLRADLRRMALSYQGVTSDTVGYWEDGGSVYVDLGTMHGDLYDALRIAASRGEIAIYDRYKGECVVVPYDTPGIQVA